MSEETPEKAEVPVKIDWGQAIGALQNVQSIALRTEAIVGAEYVDELLEALLRAFFIDDDKSATDVFDNRGPIGTFGARIDLAFLLGLISENERRMLDFIRKIRNEFSHSSKYIDFETSQVKNWCLNLFEMSKTAKAIFGKPIDFGDPETRFIFTVICLVLIFEERKKEISRREKRQPITDDQIASLIQNLI